MAKFKSKRYYERDYWLSPWTLLCTNILVNTVNCRDFPSVSTKVSRTPMVTYLMDDFQVSVLAKTKRKKSNKFFIRTYHMLHKQKNELQMKTIGTSIMMKLTIMIQHLIRLDKNHVLASKRQSTEVKILLAIIRSIVTR